MIATIDTVGQPYHLREDGRLSLDMHPGQWTAWDSLKRFIFVLAGTQSGKTTFGPVWLHREVYHPEIGRGGGRLSGRYWIIRPFQAKNAPIYSGVL